MGTEPGEGTAPSSDGPAPGGDLGRTGRPADGPGPGGEFGGTGRPADGPARPPVARRGTARLIRYGFTDPDRAATLLAGPELGWWDPAAAGAPDPAAAALVSALASTADPDRAVLGLDRLVAAQPDAAARDRLRGALRGDPRLAARLFAVLGASAELTDHLVAYPDDWETLAGAGVGAGPPALDAAVAGQPTGAPAVAALRRAYRRELLCVAAADLTGARGVEETMAALTALADATLAAALAIAEAERAAASPDETRGRDVGSGPAAADPAVPGQAAPVRPTAGSGEPAPNPRVAESAVPGAVPAAGGTEPGARDGAGARLAVLAMGKCGGRELNYVSDVDVLFVAAPGGDGEPAPRAATDLARRLIDVCRQVAWPVDAGLRPEGHNGPLVRTVASYRAYYTRWAKTWEFQALLKARPAAGDAALAEEFLAVVRPLVWQTDGTARPSMVDEVRAMRRRVEEQLPAADADREIKLGPGGLRDIEFAVQLLQLVHGRSDEQLREPGTLDALRALTAGGYVGRADGEELDSAYRFLRTVEHRLQLQALRRTHRIPDDAGGLRWLAQSLGFRAEGQRTAVDGFLRDWSRLARNVRRLHEKLLYRPLLAAVARVPTDGLRLTSEAARSRLAALGFDDPAGALRHIAALTGGVSRTAAIQRGLLPALLPVFADAPEPDHGLLAYRQVSEQLGRTPWYLRLLRDSGPVAMRLARLLGVSRYVTDLLARDPEALRLLADDAELAPRAPAALGEAMSAAVRRHRDRPAEAVAALRALRRRELFRIACADLLDRLDVTAVGAALSDLTDAVLAAALRVARAAADAPDDLRMTIVGMGRLGGRETGYGSDADVLFVHDGAHQAAATAVAERLRALLQAPAPDPPLLVDAGLRPEGRQGPLVRSLAAYRSYYARWSRVWEAQALLRARYVAGDERLGADFLAMADPVRYPRHGLRREQIVEIRRIKARVDSERLPRGADPTTHTKLGRGGLADVEWTVQLFQLTEAGHDERMRTTGTLDALDAAVRAGLLAADEAAALAAAWRLASRVRNAMMLVRGRPSDQLPRHGVELAGVVAALHWSGRDPGEFLDEYLRTARRARQVVAEHMGTGG